MEQRKEVMKKRKIDIGTIIWASVVIVCLLAGVKTIITVAKFSQFSSSVGINDFHRDVGTFTVLMIIVLFSLQCHDSGRKIDLDS